MRWIFHDTGVHQTLDLLQAQREVGLEALDKRMLRIGGNTPGAFAFRPKAGQARIASAVDAAPQLCDAGRAAFLQVIRQSHK